MTKNDRRILAYINRVRSARGKSPLRRIPKGDKRNLEGCPIARGTGVPSGMTSFVLPSVREANQLAKVMKLSSSRQYVVHPLYVQDWIDDFDSGSIPELIK